MNTMIIVTTCIVCLVSYIIILQCIHRKLKYITPFIFFMGQSFKEMVQGKKKMNFVLKIAIMHYFWLRKAFLNY